MGCQDILNFDKAICSGGHKCNKTKEEKDGEF